MGIRFPRLADLALWLPVLPPLAVAALAYLIGLHLRSLDPLTVVFALLGPWGAAAGLLAGHVARGASLRRSLLSFAASLVLIPVATTVLTAALAMPAVWLLRYRGLPATQIALVVVTWWYLISAGIGVELTDRLSRPVVNPSAR